MSLDRRAFLAALLALPFGAKSLELLEPEPELEDLKLVRYTSRIEATEEVLEKIHSSRDAFLEWAEEELPRRADELTELMKRTFENDIVESVVYAPPDFLAPASGEGAYFETAQLSRSS